MSVSASEVQTFTRGFSHRIEEGQSLVRSLLELEEQQTSDEFRHIIEQIRHDLESGHRLSIAVRKHPDIFSSEYADTIRQGEINGNLDVMLRQMCSP